MRKFVAVIFAVCLCLALGISAHAAEIDITITPISEAIAPISSERQPVSVEIYVAGGVPVIKRTYEVAQDFNPQSLVLQPFEQDGHNFAAREILYEVLPGPTHALFASVTARTVTDTDDVAEILRQFPAAIDHAEGGYSGRLHLDVSSISTRPDRPETYTYTFTRTREVPGLPRNDPAYLDRAWNGMTLTNVSFARGWDGLYTATAIYTGTATGSREVNHITTARYYGEITKILPGNVLFTVVYEGIPIVPELPAPPQGQLTVDNGQLTVEESPAAMIEIEPEQDELPAKENSPGTARLLVIAGAVFLAVAGVTALFIIKSTKGRETMKQLLHNRKAKYIAALAVLTLVVVIIIAVSGVPTQPEAPDDYTPRFDIETADEIDFDNPGIMVHTADDGIAVVGSAPPQTTDALPAPLRDEPPRVTSDPTTIWQSETAPTHTHGGFTLPVPMDGNSIGVLTVPAIGLTVRVYEGEDEMELMERGIAHFRSTSAWYGNVALSAHNVNLDGSDGYFLHLYRLRPGAAIIYETALGRREYVVESVTEISEDDWSLLARTEDNRLTLITCITGRPDLRLAVVAVERN